MAVTARLCVAFLLLLAACDNGSDDEPYIEFAGGGFIVNYRVADAYYGFIAHQKRRIPSGTLLIASFEDPAGGAPLVVEQTARWGQLDYSFRSPPLKGIVADRDYWVELRLVDPENKTVLATYRKAFQSSVDQTMVPDKPLTVGPGYKRNPSLGPLDAD